jgi:hypothetical protein
VYTDIKVYNKPSFWFKWIIRKHSRLKTSLLKNIRPFWSINLLKINLLLTFCLTNQWVTGRLFRVSPHRCPELQLRPDQDRLTINLNSFEAPFRPVWSSLKVNFIFISWWLINKSIFFTFTCSWPTADF